VSFEDRQDLLGHKSQRMATHYSEAELVNLIAAAEKACEGTGALTALEIGVSGRNSVPIRAFEDLVPGAVLRECSIPDLL
jgi:hypothetical protein